MASISKLKPGQTVYETTRNQMGNTTMRTTSVRPVRIVEVHEDHVIASWNSNAPRKYSAQKAKAWKVGKPYIVRSTIGGQRIATKEEVKAAKDAGTLQENVHYILVPRTWETRPAI